METGVHIERAGNAAALAKAYQPIIRGYFVVAAAYYAIMTCTHFWLMGGAVLATMATVSTVACLCGAGAAWALRKPLGVAALELLCGLVNILIIANVLIALHLEYAEAKLIYFVMIAMIFAFASVSLRQAALSIVAAIGGLFYQVGSNAEDQMLIYGFIAFAAALSALAIAFFLRRAIVMAVSARKTAEARLRRAEEIGEVFHRQSHTDELTGLPNRRAFFERFDAARAEPQAGNSHHTWLALLDLDGFKAVNDNHGHMIGDELLKEVASRLGDYCGDDAFVSRMGGDEFNIILGGMHGDRQVETWAGGLLAEIGQTYLIEERLIQISGSIGCCMIPDNRSEDKIVQKADYALMHAKRNGKDRVVIFRKEHEQDAAERFAIEQALRVADFESEIELLFQPQFHLGKGTLVMAEALARWNSPIIGQVEPDRFIKIAEESGLIAKITLAVVDKALAQLAAWDDPIPLSINLSGHDLLSDQIMSQIIRRVRASGIDPALVEFEVTETALMVDMQRATTNLSRLSQLGHPLALDDFGTGYSNFNYLRALPIGKLKVDRSFMQEIGDPMTEKVLRSLAGMARTLGVHCLLEGIESDLELMLARRVGAQSVQGYLFGKPMTASRLATQFAQIDEGNAAPSFALGG